MIEEVHLWRGTAEQRALRAALSKRGQFAYFDRQLECPDWPNKTVLDFGGNQGNLLLDPSCSIRHENYYCLDVIPDAIAAGRSLFPAAHWIHYDRYNCSFNPDGVADLPVPDPGLKFDLILAFSVFTHTTWEETRELIEQLRALLVAGGKLAFTFIDPHWNDNLRWRLAKRHSPADLDRLLEQSREAEWCALVNGTDLHLNSSGVWLNQGGECATYNVYYTAEFLQKQFPYARIRTPVNDEMQHCCILDSL